jgi:predicted RNA-binding protein with PUA-like domain
MAARKKKAGRGKPESGGASDPGPAANSARPRHWLLKTEPTSFSFDDLLRAPRRRTSWDGVRNHQARNFLRDAMQPGDLVLVYHSSAEPPGVAGVARVASPARADASQFDPADEHFDPKARRDDPTWYAVEIEALRPAARFVPLDALRRDPRLARMLVLQRGQRLSVQPVQPAEWRVVLELAGLDPDEIAAPPRMRPKDRETGPSWRRKARPDKTL